MLATALLLATLSIEDYATMPTLSAPRVSPDGARIAYVLTRADMVRSAYDADVWVINADGSGDTQLTRSGGNDTSPKWSPDGKTIAFLSDRDGRTAVWLLNASGGEAWKLTSDSTGVRMFEWSPDGKSIAYVMPDPAPPEEEKKDARVVGEGTRYVHLYVAEVATHAARRVTKGDFSIARLSWSQDGAHIAIDQLPGNGLDDLYRSDIAIVDIKDGSIRPLVVRPGMDTSPRWSPDGKSIAFISTGGVHDWLREQQLYVVPAAGGEPRVAAPEYGRSPDDFAWDDDSQTIWMSGPWNTTTQIFRLGANFSHLEGLATDVDVHGHELAFIEQTLTAPPELYVSDTQRFAPRQLTHHNDALRGRELGPTRVIRWKNPQDGREIEGLLTLPVGYVEGRRYPLLTFVHGGPSSRFDQGFIGYLGWLYAPHALAARGFAVLRPNPRGTGGYGQSFRDANRNDWAGRPWSDINAGIDEAIRLGVADPDRLGLMGWSYGGYMAAWAIGHSDRLKAISVGAPVVDLLSFHGTTDIRDFIPTFYPAMPLDLLREQSPLWHLKKIAAPVLIQHGEADERVPPSQGTMLYRMLNELGVDVTMVTYPRSPHVPREPRQRVDVARRNMEFFARALLRE